MPSRMEAEREEAPDLPGTARDRRWPLRPIPALLIATLIISGFFLAFPEFDIWFSGLFYDSELGFPAADIPVLRWLRRLSDTLVWIIGVALIVSLLGKLILPRRASLIAPRVSLFLGSTLLIGPGLIVNAILKPYWGRPRPSQIVEFGGDAPFVEAWRITDLCDGNCSFVSGEASSAIWLLAVAIIATIVWRNRAIVAALALTVIFSLNRIAFGGHFLSDVLLSWTLTLLVIALAYRLIFVAPPPGLANTRIEAAFTRAGLKIQRLFGGGSHAQAELGPGTPPSSAERGIENADE